MASIAADVLQNPIPVYAVSKGAVRTLTYALATELGPLGIRVNAIAPGTIQTDINKARWQVPGVKERATAGVPVRRLGVPTDIGPAVTYLASDYASFVSGCVFVVDGGRSHNIG
jgi:NAD(P)-dependent dehydrogenase (short-subunit alcohol dehydrogenase family)